MDPPILIILVRLCLFFSSSRAYTESQIVVEWKNTLHLDGLKGISQDTFVFNLNQYYHFLLFEKNEGSLISKAL